MMSKEGILAVIDRARTKLKEKFALCEKTILSEIRIVSDDETKSENHSPAKEKFSADISNPAPFSEEVRLTQKGNENVQLSIVKESSSVLKNIPHESEKLLVIQEELKKERELNRNLEETLQRLKESLKVMGQEYEELQNENRQYEEEQKKIVAVSKEEMARKLSENKQLEERMERYKSGRHRVAQLLKRLLYVNRGQKKMIDENKIKNDEHDLQIKKLTDELDAALEHVAELRDGLYLTGETHIQNGDSK